MDGEQAVVADGGVGHDLFIRLRTGVLGPLAVRLRALCRRSGGRTDAGTAGDERRQEDGEKTHRRGWMEWPEW